MSSGEQPSEKPVSFAELAEREFVAPDELVDCLADYARNGWAILGEVVIGIAERTRLDAPKLQALGVFAHQGMEQQLAGGRYQADPASRPREVAQYELIAAYAEFELAKIAALN